MTDYKEYADFIRNCNGLWEKEVKAANDELNIRLGDYRYSEKAKEDLKKKVFSELNETGKNLSIRCKEAVSMFCKDYKVKLPEDGKDHSKDIDTALRVIDMLGTGLDEKNLVNIMGPLRGSFRSTKTIVDLITAKNEALSGTGKGYDPKIIQTLINDYSAVKTGVYDYIELYETIKGVAEKNAPGYRFVNQNYSNSPVVDMQVEIPYSLMASPDWIEQAGKLYSVLESEFSSLFTEHIPTDRERFDSVLKS